MMSSTIRNGLLATALGVLMMAGACGGGGKKNPSCENALNPCETEGQKRCSADGSTIEVCNDTDEDGCFEWGDPTPCEQGQVCDSATFECVVAQCEDECDTAGVDVCSSDHLAVQSCSDSDDDGCLELGDPQPCNDNSVCDDATATCTQGCQSECPAAGATECTTDLTGTRTCGDLDGNGCLEWGEDEKCPDDQVCNQTTSTCETPCTSACNTEGSTQCAEDLTGIVTCADTNGDGCFEWSAAVPCDAGNHCDETTVTCVAGCVNACETQDEVRCSDDFAGTQTCADTNGDDCFEWGTVVACADGFVCNPETTICEIGCVDACDTDGATQCAEDFSGIQTCGDGNGDGCYEWSTAVACDAGFVCDAATTTCVVGCTDDCDTDGDTQCSEDGLGIQTCGNFDDDDCLEWSDADACDADQHCDADTVTCVAGCLDGCTTAGDITCSVDFLGIQTCGNFDTDTCLEWGDVVACEVGMVCEAATTTCVPVCTDTCDTADLTQCAADLTGIQTCGDANGDGCLEWSETVPCDDNFHCDVATVTCMAGCADECPDTGLTQCSADLAGIQTCGNFDEDLCFEWGDVAACDAGMACDTATITCLPTCSNDCDMDGHTACTADLAGIQTCGNFDEDVCLEWGNVLACDTGWQCDTATVVCVQLCADDCTPAGSNACTTDLAGVLTCGNYDADSCLEWSDALPCDAGLQCDTYSNSCVVPCTNDCDTAGATQCTEDVLGVQTCGNYDADSCLEWGDLETCEPGFECQGETPGCVLVAANRLWIEPTNGCVGDIISVPVMLATADTQVDAFTMTIDYDQTVLQYTNYEQGDIPLGQAWIMFNANPISVPNPDPDSPTHGFLGVAIAAFGGMGEGAGVQPGNEGSLIFLNFQVICSDCVSGDQSPVAFRAALDDVSSFARYDDEFTFCP